MGAGSLKASCKNKRKESSIFTANRFKQFATNTSSQDNLLNTRSNKDMLPATPTRKRNTSQRMGERRFQGLRKRKNRTVDGHSSRETGKPIVEYASHLPKGTIKEIECCFDHGLYLAVTYEDGQKAKVYKLGSSVGVDLGEVHTIGAFCENGQALLITGRKIRSLYRLRNKKLTEIQRRQSKCQKGSCRWKKYERAKQYVLSKSERQLRDALHQTAKQFVD
jgi:transposase